MHDSSMISYCKSFSFLFLEFGGNLIDISTEIQLANNVKLEGHPNHLTWQKQ